MNITLSIDEATAEAARKVAREQGTSLNDLIRQFVAGLAGQRSRAELAAELVALFEEHPGDSKGVRITREDAYDGRL
jgi:hypothetical protein